MLPQQLKLSDITDERTAQLYIDQVVMVAFCRVLDTARLSPDVVMRLLATALGGAYRQVAAAHIDGQCPCGWCPSPDDIETMRAALGGAARQVRREDLHTMAMAGRA